MVLKIWVNIGSGNGLLPEGTKPLPEPMLTSHQSCCVAFTWEQMNFSRIMYLQIAFSKLLPYLPGASELTYWGRKKMAAICQTTFSNAFSWMRMYEFRLKFHWNLFHRVQLTISQHWFRWWLGAGQATSQCLNQCWLVYWCINASLGLNVLTVSSHNRLGQVLASWECVILPKTWVKWEPLLTHWLLTGVEVIFQAYFSNSL